MKLPETLQQYIDDLDPPAINNSRQIVRNDFIRILTKHRPPVAKYLIQKKYGIDLDYIPGLDDGETIEPVEE